ncbi:MAG TPA: MFS transporter [Gemmataceae bacterium]|nr:MFS transporter [Gemmataceae bacterium]
MSPRAKFSIMMFLEFFIWGAWLPPIFEYLNVLHFGFWEQALVLNAFAVASLTGMFFSTQFADRNFAAEKFLAFSHLVGGAAILGVGWATTFPVFCTLLLVHSLFYVPTISITNSIAFSNLPNAADDFPRVRLWGTIGWIAAAVPQIFFLVDWSKPSLTQASSAVDWLSAVLSSENAKTGDAYMNAISMTYVTAGIASLVLAGFSLTLPHTPPKPARADESGFAWLEAMRVLKHPFMLVLFVATFIDAGVHQGYFVMTFTYLKNAVNIPAQWIMPVMTIGQFAEIGTMAILGFVLKRLGWRTTMIIGILGHTARFAVFAFFPSPQIAPILVNVLHGICYAFFFATVYIFVDEFFPKDVRASAQGLFNFLIIGVGPLLGNFLWPYLQGVFTSDVDGVKVVDYRTLFMIPAGIALGAAVMLLFFFHPPRASATQEYAARDAAPVDETAYGIKAGEPPVRSSH